MSARRHRSLPSVARTEQALCMVWVTYCRTPPPSDTTSEAYPAPSFKSSDRHRTLPVILSRAATAPLFPPGVQTTLSPSIRTDSQYPQPGIDPPRSLTRFLAQTDLPSVRFRQRRSPLAPRTYTRSPSTVGVLRGPVPHWYAYPPLAVSIGVRQSSLPVAGSRAWANSLSPLSGSSAPRMTSLPLATAGLPYPTPSLSVLNRSFGPPSGHFWSRPVAAEWPSRLGPRHWGQSPGRVVYFGAGAATDRASTTSWIDDMGPRQLGSGRGGGGRAGGRRAHPVDGPADWAIRPDGQYRCAGRADKKARDLRWTIPD